MFCAQVTFLHYFLEHKTVGLFRPLVKWGLMPLKPFLEKGPVEDK